MRSTDLLRGAFCALCGAFVSSVIWSYSIDLIVDRHADEHYRRGYKDASYQASLRFDSLVLENDFLRSRLPSEPALTPTVSE